MAKQAKITKKKTTSAKTTVKAPASKTAAKPAAKAGAQQVKTGRAVKAASSPKKKPAATGRKTAATKASATPAAAKKEAARAKPAGKGKKTPTAAKPAAKAKVQKKPAASGKTAPRNLRTNPKAALAGKPKAARRGDEARTPDEKSKSKAVKAAVIKKKAGSAQKKGADKNKPVRPIAFTLDEALEIAKTKSTAKGKQQKGKTVADQPKEQKPAAAAGKKEVSEDVPQENRVLGAASVADILGYNPNAKRKKPAGEEGVPTKFARYYKLLVELREHVLSGLDMHTKETLKRSAKDDTGDLSAYSQHMADAGTDTFDRDFALSLVSSEQDALYEIEDAIKRIRNGTYGVCEITGKPINKERLLAVPFAKFSVEGQVEYERTHRRSAYRGGAFGDSGDDSVQFLEDEVEE